MKQTYYYAHAGCWWGLVGGAIHKDDQPPPFSRWLRIPKDEYRELKREGFRVRTNKDKPMPFGHHIATCRDCGKQWMVGDCVPSKCRECQQRRTDAVANKTPGHCHECGYKLSHDGTCFDCRLFGKVTAQQRRDGVL